MSGYSVPTDAQAKEALRRIPTFQLRRAFYEALNNPNWVEPLYKAGAFAPPPERTVDAEGLVQEVYWPEIDYLSRVAPEAPTAVVDVLLSLRKSTNSWIRRRTFELGASLPIEEAARLKPLVDSWKGDFGFRTDPRHLTAFARTLIEGGDMKFARQFLNTLFRPKPNPDKRRDPVTTLEDYWYSEELPGVVAALGDSALGLVLPWLEEWERASGRFTDDSDVTSISRSDIGSRDEGHHDAEQALIDSVRDVTIRDLVRDPRATAAAFTRTPMALLRKIILYAAAKAIDAAGDHVSDDLLSTGVDLLEDPISHNSLSRIEFADLYIALRRNGRNVDDVVRQLITVGRFEDRDELITRLKQRRPDEDDYEKLADEEEAYWRQRLLSTIARDNLPADLQAQLDELDGQLGAIESPREPDFKFTSWSGPTSPTNQEELAGMMPAALAEHLATWHSDDAWMGPTHEGMARELQEVVAAKPRALEGETGLTEVLRPTYLRAIMTGWNTARKSNLDLDWAQVLDVARGILAHDYESTIPVEGRDFDDDADFSQAKQAAVTLLVDAARLNEKHPVPPEVMAEAADALLAHFDDDRPWTVYDARSASDNMDPLTVSLNWQWPIMMRGLVNLMGHGPDAPWFVRAAARLEQELTRDDKIGAGRSVIGEGFARLFNNAPTWLGEHHAQIFGSEAGLTRLQQIALTTVLATHRNHPKLLESLRGPLMAAMELKEPIAMGWDGNSKGPELIGHWIINALILGFIQPDDALVESFFSKMPPDVRGNAVGHIAWSFMHAAEVDHEIRARFEQLWDARVAHVREHLEDLAELDDFYWLVRSEKFEPAWWIPRLKEAAQLNPALSTHGMIGEQLAAAAPGAPRDILDILKLLLSEQKDGMRDYDLKEHAVARAIAAALESNDVELRKDGERFMNHLGAKHGMIKLEARVKAIRDGKAEK
jgi:hypothetical protein